MTRLQGHRTNNRDLEEHQTSPKLNFNLPVLDRFFEPLHRDGARFAVQQKRLGGTVKLSGIPGFWRRNRSSVERRINNLGTCQGAD